MDAYEVAFLKHMNAESAAHEAERVEDRAFATFMVHGNGPDALDYAHKWAEARCALMKAMADVTMARMDLDEVQRQEQDD